MKHKIGVILRDKKYSKLLELIFKGYSKNKDILLPFEEYQPNIYASKLSNYLANINGKYHKFIKDNGQKKTNLIEYTIDYEGISEFIFTYFFGKYLKQLPKDIVSLINYGDKELNDIVKRYMEIMYREKLNNYNLHTFFHRLLVEVYKITKKQEFQFNEFYEKLTKSQKQILLPRINKVLETNIPYLKEDQHKEIITYTLFQMLSTVYVEEILENSGY